MEQKPRASRHRWFVEALLWIVVLWIGASLSAAARVMELDHYVSTGFLIALSGTFFAAYFLKRWFRSR